MQRKAVKGSVYKEILWLAIHNFDGRGNVALVDAKIINSSGRYTYMVHGASDRGKPWYFIGLRFAIHYVLFYLFNLLLRILTSLEVFNFKNAHQFL
jgi:hypothetical protein